MMSWPGGKKFAFTVFDDPDGQSLPAGRMVYEFLHQHGLCTTKAIWPIRGRGEPPDEGDTCETPAYREWVQQLQSLGFEIALHNATYETSRREDTLRGLDKFVEYFGSNPKSFAQHYNCQEGIYWGDSRLTGLRRATYNLLTLGLNRNVSFGHLLDHDYFWGDLCTARIKYVRNLGCQGINTLSSCPMIPYHDPLRPYVNFWFSCSEGTNCNDFVNLLNRQQELVEEGGCCLAYTHFGHGYVRNGQLNSKFCRAIERLATADGWFVPVSTILDFLLAQKNCSEITDQERSNMEWRWLREKIRVGTK